METLPKIFTGTAPTKSEITEGANEVISLVVDGGEVCPLKVATQLKAMETAIKLIKAGIEEAVLNEAEKEPEKSFDRAGHGYQVRAGGVKYFYTECNDPVLDRLTDSLNDITEKKKEREGFLNVLSGSMNVVDEDTGEVVEVFPPSKESKTVVAITLAK